MSEVSIEKVGNRCILLAEDDNLLSDTLVDTLERLQFEVTTVRCPNDAIEKLRKQSYRCILLDFHLEQGTGEEVIQYVQSTAGRGIGMPLILMSGMLSKESASKYLPQVYSVLIKPFSEDQLIKVFLEALENSK